MAEGDREERSIDENWEDAVARRPLVDGVFRAYLDALPALLAAGKNGGWFMSDSNGVRTAAGMVRDETRQEYSARHNSTPIIEVLIAEGDLTKYRSYYAQKLRQQTPEP